MIVPPLKTKTESDRKGGFKKYARSTPEQQHEVRVIESYRKQKEIEPYLKVIACGPVIKVYQMDRPPEPSSRESEAEVDRTEERRKLSAKRSRNTVQELCLMNFDNHSKFITLTFKENLKDVREANRRFKRFIQRLRYRYQKFKYVAVVEFQKRGAVHYHMISDLPYIRQKELLKIWENGFVGINDITHVDNIGAYMVKYMLKYIDDERLRGLKSYQTSKGLQRPLELTGEEAQRVLEVYSINESTPVYENAYASEYHGFITFQEYNINRT